MSCRSFLALVSIVTLSCVPGCDTSSFRRAQRLDSRAGYLRYLARYPDGSHAGEARQRLEMLRYRMARRADRPYGYRLYLEHHPDGTFARACRGRLAQLALERARTPSDMLLIQRRYAGTPEAAEAARRHAPLLAELALARRDPSYSELFLDLYPGRREATRIRQHLAELLYPALTDEEDELETFAQDFAGTPYGDRALSRLEKLLGEEVRQTLSPAALRRFKTRFPHSVELVSFETLVSRERMERALIELNIEKLEAQPGNARDIRLALQWCHKHEKSCASVRELARRARPWQPEGTLERLRARSYSPEMEEAWKAIASLGWIDDRAAGDHLLELVSSRRLSTVWTATRALHTWLGRLSTSDRARWIARLLKRSYREANPDEEQRQGYLFLLGSRVAEGRTLLAGVMERSGRTVAASYLLASWEQGARKAVSRATMARLVAAARARVKLLEQAFPPEIHQDSLSAATLAERELFVVKRVLEDLHPPSSGLRDLLRTTSDLLSGWHAKLIKSSRDFHPAQQIDLAEEVARHEKERAVALQGLRTHPSPAARIVARAICQRYPDAYPDQACALLKRR